MTSFDLTDDLRGARFNDVDLTGARFAGCDLSGIVMRGVQLEGAEIDAPWLFEGQGLRVNGVDVTAYVDAELNRRFPGREQRRAEDPEGLRQAWTALHDTWAATVARAAVMPGGTVDVSVAGEWSFAQTLRHLVLATDMWLGRAVLGAEQPFHPLGLADDSLEMEGFDMSVFTTQTRRTTRCSRPVRSASRWSATTSRASPRTSWRRSGETRTTPTTRRPRLPACT